MSRDPGMGKQKKKIHENGREFPPGNPTLDLTKNMRKKFCR